MFTANKGNKESTGKVEGKSEIALLYNLRQLQPNNDWVIQMSKKL